MKLTTEKIPGLTQTEILVHYSRMDTVLMRLLRTIRSFEKTITAKDDKEREIQVHIPDICYVESVDRAVFLYEAQRVSQCHLRLRELLALLEPFGFCAVSKSCLVNLHCIQSVSTLPNSRLKAVLDNGEAVIVTRSHIPTLRKKMEEHVR